MRSLFHLLRFAIGLDAADSQVTDRELEMLLQYARDSRTVCEIGCYEGRTSVALARNTAGSVYSIDLFFRGRIGICYTEWVAKLNRWRNGAQNLFYITGLSQDVGRRFELPIDFLFIDADHSYEGVKMDWREWFPKVTQGGYIALHDSKPAVNSPQFLGSMRFYSEDVPKIAGIRECDGVDSLVILQRTGSDQTGVKLRAVNP
jgi:predicted O-methyltransferase YrrM